MLLSSMWLDLWLAPRSTVWAYTHSGLVYLATAVAFYFAMLRLLRERWLALATTVAWMLLPSTTVLVEFLSTRHYLIGMFWALLAAMSVDDALKARPGPRTLLLVRVAAFTWLSIISKEFFPPAVLTLTFLWFAWRRDWRGAAIPVVLGALYAIYRVVDDRAVARLLRQRADVAKPGREAAPAPALHDLRRMGRAMRLCALTAVLLRRQVRADRALLPVVAIGGATLLVSLLVIYPVGNPVANAWSSFGTWYRTPCVINTLLLVAFAYAVANLGRSAGEDRAHDAAVARGPHGSHRTAGAMGPDEGRAGGRSEVHFREPGQDAGVTGPCGWFLRGVERSFPTASSAPSCAAGIGRSAKPTGKLLRSSRPFWVYEDGKVRPGNPRDAPAPAVGDALTARPACADRPAFTCRCWQPQAGEREYGGVAASSADSPPTGSIIACV